MKNKTNTIPVKGTVVEAILEEFRGFYDPDGFSEKKLEAFLSSALLRVQEETREETLREVEDCFDWLPDKHSIQGKALKEELAKLKENMTTEGMVVRAVTGHKSSIDKLKIPSEDEGLKEKK